MPVVPWPGFRVAPSPVLDNPLPPPHRLRLPAAQVVYLDLSEITYHRKIKLEGPAPAPGGGRRPSLYQSPSSRRVQKLLQRLTPADPCEDPYLVALLIAMAQE